MKPRKLAFSPTQNAVIWPLNVGPLSSTDGWRIVMVQLAYYVMLLLCIAMTAGCERSSESDSDSPKSSSSAGRLDPSKVPADLRELVPLVQDWGIGDSVERGDKVKGATPAERER